MNRNNDYLEGLFDDYNPENEDSNGNFEKRLRLSKLMKKLFKSVI